MSRKLERLDTRKTRKQLREKAAELTDEFDKKKSVLANAFGIKGMGKDHLLALIVDDLDSKAVQHLPIINIPESPTSTEVLDISKQIAEWIYSDILLKPKEKVSRDMDGLEKSYFNLRGKLNDKKDKPRFAVLINDIDNLPFDDLDWFQSVVLEALVSSPGSMVVVTSQNELNWHSWEMRNKCTPVKLPVFSQEEILELSESKPLAQRIWELSAGHPETVQALLNVASKKKPLASITEADIKTLEKELLDQLEKEINDSLNLKGENEWLRDVFYLISAADGFDADLVSDIVSAFNLSIPEEVTDIAWEMAYTGLAYWDFDAKTYKIVPELRERIFKFIERSRRNDLVKVLDTIANSFLLRAEILPEKDKQLSIYRDYLVKKEKYMALQDQDKSLDGGHNEKGSLNYSSRSSERYGGGLMNKRQSRRIKDEPWGNYVPRNLEEDAFKQLLRNDLGNKWIVSLKGDAGLGKSRLLVRFYEIAKESNYDVAFIDLHDRKNRYREIFLTQLIAQLNIQDKRINDLIDRITNPKKTTDYTGISLKEFFEESLHELVELFVEQAGKLTTGNNRRPLIIIDTFDINEDPSIDFLATWLSSDLIPLLNNSAYVVIAGRNSLLELSGLLDEVREGTQLINFTKLSGQFLQNFVSTRLEDLKLDISLAKGIVNLSDGSPLIADWVLFYLSEIGTWADLAKFGNREEVLEYLAQRMWQSKESIMEAFRAAVHFGSHFNLSLFKAVVSNRDLNGKSHEEVFERFSKSFYVRGSVEKWTLHDEIRERMFLNFPGESHLSPLIKFSEKSIEKYYVPEINRRRSKVLDLYAKAELEDLEAQKFYHLLFVDSKSHHHALWDRLDYLWHQYQLDQMFQLIQFGREVQKWNIKASPNNDKLLTNLLDAAFAWMSFSADEYVAAREYARKVLDSDPPRRLKATANVVLGFSTQNPKVAIIDYLIPAQRIYTELRNELEHNNVLRDPGEFCDKLDDVYQELHMVLINIGRMQWQHFYDLEEGEDVLRRAYKLANSERWNKPLYQATALNELARIRRFRGEFHDAFDMASKAITIYEEHDRRDVNLGYFYETLGLVEKAHEHYTEADEYFNKALNIYNSIKGSLQKYTSSVQLEIGHVFFLRGKFAEADRYYLQAYESLRSFRESRLFYYLSALNKLGELQIAKFKESGVRSYLTDARRYFSEQKKISFDNGFDLWDYWATQNLAEIDFIENWPENKQALIDTLAGLLMKYDRELHREFGPAFWETKYLMFSISLKEGDKTSALMNLADGLAYLAKSWKRRFDNKINVLRHELINLEPKERSQQARKLIELWKTKFSDADPAPGFIQMCQSFIS